MTHEQYGTHLKNIFVSKKKTKKTISKNESSPIIDNNNKATSVLLFTLSNMSATMLRGLFYIWAE